MVAKFRFDPAENELRKSARCALKLSRRIVFYRFFELCVVASAAYLFLGIDEIGLQIEQPFFVMPVHALAEGLTRDVVEELSHN